MKELHDTLTLFGDSLAGSLLIALVGALLGVHVVGRRMVLTGVALPQVAAGGIGLSSLAEGVAWTAPGTALALLRNHGLMATAACVAALAFLVRRPGPARRAPEVRTGAIYALGGAVAVLAVQSSALGMEELRHHVEGEILAIHGSGLAGLAAVLGAVLVPLALLHRRFVFVTFDPEMAATLGIRVARHDLLFHALLAVAVARSVHAAGTLFVFAALVLPAAAGLTLARSVAGVFTVAVAAGLLGTAAGFLLAVDERVDWPVGPTCAAALVACWLLATGIGRLRDPRTGDVR